MSDYLQCSKNITEAMAERKCLFLKVSDGLGKKKTDKLTHTQAFFHTAESVPLICQLV